jgi:hypothetical protein
MHFRAGLTLATALVFACAVPWVACGGSSSSPGGGGEGGASSSSGGGSSGGGSSGGGSSGGGSSGSGSSSGSASSSGGSSGGDAGAATCPAVPCTGSQVCCADLTNDTAVCADTCAPADTIACVKPSDCPGATPDCCATDILDGMDAGASFPHCYTQSLTTKCVASCVSAIKVSCTATETLHVCEATSDCATDTANPNCCVVAGYHVCVSTILMKLGSLSCL